MPVKPKFTRSALIEKVEENSDGTLNVHGYASTEERDSDGEKILASAMADATAGYMKWGAVREMHQPKAAGVALAAETDPATGRTNFSAHVVDPVACDKVRKGVYKAFSIRGPVLARDPVDPTIITKLKWVETSLVDRPANEGATIDEVVLVKADGIVEIEKSMYSISRLADLLASLQGLAQDAAYSAADMAWPEGVRAGMKCLCDALTVAVAEETGALTGDVASAVAKVAGLESQVAALSAERDALKAAAATAAPADVVTKLEGEKTDLVGKVSGLGDQVVKLQGEKNDALAKVSALTTEVDELKKAREKDAVDLKAATDDLFAKGLLRSVGKVDDVSKLGTTDDQEPKTPREAIKMAHKGGGTIVPVGVR